MNAMQTPTATHRTPGVLHMVCGKIGSGKSTLARQLAQAPATARISEDEWLAQLHPGEIQAVADYACCAGRLRAARTQCFGRASVRDVGCAVRLDQPLFRRAG